MSLKNVLAELQNSWGEPGVSGDDRKIIRACKLYVQCGGRFFEISEEISFTVPPNTMENLNVILAEGAMHNFSKLNGVIGSLKQLLNEENPTGERHFNLVFDLPQDWSIRFSRELELAAASLKNHIPSH